MGPLEGIKVVDLSRLAPGPYGSMLLGDLGAEVIRVDPPGTEIREGNMLARNKRSIVLNLKLPEAQSVLHRLCETADVLLESNRPGVSKRLGADYETLKKINPGIIYCSASGYGQTGPYWKKPGFDPLLQARSGAMAHQGGPGNPPVFLVLAISDYGAALLAAYGVALALYARARTGNGQRIETSLLRACMSTQSGRFIIPHAMADGVRPVDRFGEGPTYRLYPTSDGWIFLGARGDEDWARLTRALGRDDLARDPGYASEAGRIGATAQLSAILGEVLTTDSSARWLERLESEGVPCSSVNQFADLHDHPQVLRNGLVAEHNSPDVGPIKQRGVPVILSRTPGIAQCPAPALGQHTDEILAELGYSQDEAHALRRDRIVN